MRRDIHVLGQKVWERRTCDVSFPGSLEHAHVEDVACRCDLLVVHC